MACQWFGGPGEAYSLGGRAAKKRSQENINPLKMLLRAFASDGQLRPYQTSSKAKNEAAVADIAALRLPQATGPVLGIPLLALPHFRKIGNGANKK